MNRTKYLMKNTAILFISNFASKMLGFFLLPLYTSVLTTADYGISDLITTTVHILYIFLTLYVANGIIRFTMNKVSNSDEMFSIGIYITILSTVIVAAGSGLACFLNLFPSMHDYYGYLIIIYAINCLSAVLNAFAKGKERIQLIGIAGITATAVRIFLNILLLVVIPMGIHGYLLAAVLSHVSSCMVFIFGDLLKGTRIKKPDLNEIKKVVKYSAPIAATEVGWLICTSSDKYIVAWLLGNSATGIISASHRLPTILTAFTSVFIQAWTLSAIKEADQKDKSEYYTRMFNYYNAFAISIGAVLILLSKVFGSFLFQGEFSIAWIYTPIYLTALVINTMSSFSGSIISAGTDTKPLFTSTIIGASLNLVLDIILIRIIGIFGAGIATAISYLLIGTLRMKTVKKDFDIKIDYKRMVCSIGLLSILTATMIYSDNVVFYIASAVIVIIILLINRVRLLDVAQMMRKMVKKKRKKSLEN